MQYTNTNLDWLKLFPELINIDEKAKEMLTIDGFTLTEIAHKLNYSSVAHLSAQFKKVAGLPASYFKKLNKIRRRTIQDL